MGKFVYSFQVPGTISKWNLEAVIKRISFDWINEVAQYITTQCSDPKGADDKTFFDLLIFGNLLTLLFFPKAEILNF